MFMDILYSTLYIATKKIHISSLHLQHNCKLNLLLHIISVCSACCASVFTWASTSDTEAQAARDKHNCLACAGLVCDPCSKKRVPIPAIGITAPVRVCDRCYNGWGTLFGDLGFIDDVGKSEGDSSSATAASL